jgi:hypothetical protein
MKQAVTTWLQILDTHFLFTAFKPYP